LPISVTSEPISILVTDGAKALLKAPSSSFLIVPAITLEVKLVTSAELF
jgi:hypothetical protein